MVTGERKQSSSGFGLPRKVSEVELTQEEVAHECARSHTQISWNETGPPGADGADGADGVSGYFVRKQASSYTDIQPGFSFRVDAICPIGKKPIGGGHEFLFPPSITDLIHVYKSSPQDFDDGLTGWRVEFKNYGQGPVSGLVSAIAICANVGP